MDIRNCRKDSCKDKDGNCLIHGSDGLPVQCVGRWVEDKFFFLERYLNASCEARRKFADEGNAILIDLFSGPGKCIVRDEKREIYSGGIRALNRNEAPFNECFCFDIRELNVDALKKRTSVKPNCHVEYGDSNILVDKLVKVL